MNMKAPILTATLFTTLTGATYAADPQLLNLLAPDAKVVAGVNVEQAKGTQFGQYLLSQLQTHDSEMAKLNQWSNAQDAWGISAVAPASLLPSPKTLQHGAPPEVSPFVNAGQNVQQAAGGLKLSNNVTFTGEATCDTAQNAGTLSGMVQLLVNLGLMQAKDVEAQ